MQNRNNVTRVMLGEEKIPRKWYNIVADMPEKPVPYINPGTKKPLAPSDMELIFPKDLIDMEVSSERYIDIPDEVRDLYKQYRATPLHRARTLERALDTPARIYYKYEGGNATGSHKLNTALAQVYYNKIAGRTRIATETGAGQWGSALSMATKHFGIECTVYMVRVSLEQKPYRRLMMETFGAEVLASPSNRTGAGRAVLERDPDCTGSLGIAIGEAVEDAASRADTSYALGSVLNHVLLHQTVIGLEAKLQMEHIDEYPDVIFACAGGGSNFGGIAFPFLQDKFANGRQVRCVAVEPASCPTLTRGVFAYDYGDAARLAPIVEMYTLGHGFIPSGIHAGGLRFHGESPIVSKLYRHGHIEAVAYKQNTVFDAAIQFAHAEGIVPAPESAHAVRAAIDEAVRCRESGEAKTILFGLSGNGYFDMAAYDRYLSGDLTDVEFDPKDMEKSLGELPTVEICLR
ncbi:tryptophan synthase beta chain [Clostridia bacterium]|nr:tryptophan synthase beta chain [Clostridia bacterium]